MELRIVTLYSESFAFLECQDTRHVAAAVIVKKILFLRVNRFAAGRGVDKQDDVFKSAAGLDQIGFVGKGFSAIISIFSDLSWQKVRWTINELHLTCDRARVSNIEG